MDNLTPNALATELDKLAKQDRPKIAGLPVNQREYMLHVRNVLFRYQNGVISAGQARAERRGYQIKYLQKPIDQENIELWTQSHSIRDKG